MRPSDPQPDGKPLGEHFGRYVLLERIGRGGMAEVYRAVSHGLEGFQRVFVIKRILKDKSASKDFVEMFVNEARLSALLNHPNIVQIYDFGQIEGSYFIAMEYLRGKDLLSVLRQLRNVNRLMAPEVAGYIAQQVASGLHFAHALNHGGKSLGIVHRDVSPSNIMLLRAGGVKLLDFGIAKAATETRNDSQTQVGLVKGKLSYASPEQIRGTATDARADIFALGVVLWECLTGKRLFFDKADYQTMRNVLERPVPPPSLQRPDVPPALDYIVIRALERDPDRRYPNAKMMADELESYLQEARFSPNVTTKLLDELFGEDAQQAETHIPDAASLAASAPPASTPAPELSAPVATAGTRATVGGSDVDGYAIASSVRRVPAPAPKPSSRRGLVPLVGVGLAVSAAGIFWMSRPATPPAASSQPPVVAATAPAAPAPQPAPAPAPPPPPAAVEVATNVTVKIDSEPAGADVKRPSGELLGQTPMTITVPRGTEPLGLVVSKAGYLPSRHAVVPDRDVTALVSLRSAPRAPARKAEPPARAPAATKPKPTDAPAKDEGKVREGLSIDPFADDNGAKK